MKPNEYAQKLVDLYLDWLVSQDRDAGWHGSHVIGRLIDFEGDLPMSSGYVPTDSMERECRYLRCSHYLLPLAQDAFARMPKGLRDPLLASELFKNRVRLIGGQEVRHNEFSISAELGITPKTFREKVSKARAWLLVWCERVAA